MIMKKLLDNFRKKLVGNELESLRRELQTHKLDEKLVDNKLDALTRELQTHKLDEYSYDHAHIQSGYDALVSGLQLALIEQIIPGNRARLEALRDLHKGEKCFILGNGPSLKVADLDLLKKNSMYCFASNRINLIFDETDWRPNVWGAQDFRVISAFSDDFNNIDVPTKLVSALSIINRNIMISDAIYFPHITIPRLPFWFKKDIVTEGLMTFPTITTALINIAVFMGFTKIYLLGVDHTQYQTKKSDDNVLYNDYSKIEHFSDKYFDGIDEGPAYTFGIENKNRVYHDLKSVCEFVGVKLLNSTRGGELEVIERISLEDALNG